MRRLARRLTKHPGKMSRAQLHRLRRWFCCPACSRRMFKLYRSPSSNVFACRQCHNLTYRCVQQHDKRLDSLVKAPDWLLMDLMEHGECPWRLLAARTGYVKLACWASIRGTGQWSWQKHQALVVCIAHCLPDGSVKYFLNHYPHEERVIDQRMEGGVPRTLSALLRIVPLIWLTMISFRPFPPGTSSQQSYITVKVAALVAVSPAVVIVILPVIAPVGTVAVTFVAESAVMVAFTPPNVTWDA